MEERSTDTVMARDGTVWKREQPQSSRFADHNIYVEVDQPLSSKSRANTIADVSMSYLDIIASKTL